MRRIAIAIAVLAVAGCRSGEGDGPGGDSGNGGAADGGSGVSIYDVQSESMPVGTSVVLRGVVVSAVDSFGGRVGGIYVQEPEGGEFSGVFVFLGGPTRRS